MTATDIQPALSGSITHATTHAAAAPPKDAVRAIGTPALLVVLAGAFLSMADFFIVNVALADIGTQLQAAPATLELIGGRLWRRLRAAARRRRSAR